MVRCKCGRWTNAGITCTQCRVSAPIVPEGYDRDEPEDLPATDETLTEISEEELETED
jgi:hypothetical protein